MNINAARQAKLIAIQRAHEEWESGHADHQMNVAASTSRVKDPTDYNQHHLDVDPPTGAEEEFHTAVQRHLGTSVKGWLPDLLKLRGRDPAGTERLDRYWTEGEGAAKIGWGSPGDFDRCVVQLGKYIHEDDVVKGHCARLHHRALGIWPATHAKEERGAAKAEKPAKVVAAGLAVVATDTGRVLMLQRDNADAGDPAHGTWEFPGGRLEPGEGALQAARREWAEETGLRVPAGTLTGSWTSPDGVYAGYVWAIPHEAALDLFGGRDQIDNPDDPDGDHTEALAWWKRKHFLKNPGLRPELRGIVNNVADEIWSNGMTSGELLKALMDGQVSYPQWLAPLSTTTTSGGDNTITYVGSYADDATWQFAPVSTTPSVKMWAQKKWAQKFDPAEPRDSHGKWLHLAGIADALKAWRNPKTGKVYVGGTVEGKKHVGGELIGKINMNADGTFSGSHGGLDTGKQKVKIGTSHQGHQQAVESVGHYHAMDLLQAEAQKQGNLQAHAHLVNAQKALGAGNAALAHNELKHAHATLGEGELKSSTHGLYNAHGELHGLHNEKLVSTNPFTAADIAPQKKSVPSKIVPGKKTAPKLPLHETGVHEKPTGETPDWVKTGKITFHDVKFDPTNDGGLSVKTQDGTHIGTVSQPSYGKYEFTAQHVSGFGTGKTSKSKITAANDLIGLHNEKVDQWHADHGGNEPVVGETLNNPASWEMALMGDTVPTPSPATKKPYETVGHLTMSNTTIKSTGGVNHYQVEHKPSGIVVGEYNGDGLGSGVFTHADGHVFHHGDGGYSDAKAQFIAHHNAEYSNTGKPVTKQPYETLGKINYSDIWANGKGDFIHTASHTVVGHYSTGDPSTVTHADGTKVGVPLSLSKKEALANYHNSEYGGATSTPEPSPKIVEMHEVPEPAAVASQPKAYHAAGTMLTPQDVTVKKTGEVIDKKTKIQVGKVYKNGSYWQAEHVDGHAINYGSQKGETVKALLNHHNQITATEQAVKLGDQGEWQKHGEIGAYNLHMSNLEDGVAKVTHTKTGEHIGELKVHQSGINFVVSHPNGAKFLVNNPSMFGAKQHLVSSHNNGLNIAQGKEIKTTKPVGGAGLNDYFNAPKPPTSGPKQPYETVGSVSPVGFSGTNVKKDPAGAILSSDMTQNGVVIGHTQAESDGKVTLTHADGHVVGTGITPGQGTLTDKLAHYHNAKYGTETPLATPSKPGVAAHVTSSHTHTLSPVTHEEKIALKQYTGSAYESINDKLRSLQWGSDRPTTKVAGLMHDGIEKSRLTKDTDLYRGITNVSSIFGPVGSKVGQEFTEHGFVSTSTQPHTAFGGDAKLTIHAPAGSHGMDVKSFSHYGHENEVLLQHGTKFKVNSDTVDQYGRRQIDLTVISPIDPGTPPSA